MTNRTVLILGGAGFIGRNVAKAVLASGAITILGSRSPSTAAKRLSAELIGCERRTVKFELMTSAQAWSPVLDDIDCVINCVGILRERGLETYQAVHTVAPTTLAAACKAKGIRLIHISALGLDLTHRSGFLTSKLLGERALQSSGADFCIVRPSLLEGEGGFGADWIRRLARLPVHCLPAGANGKIAALTVIDLGLAVTNLIDKRVSVDAPISDREFDLGGLEQRTLGQFMRDIRLHHRKADAIRIHVPDWMARIASHLCDVVHFSPFSFGHWELLNCPNVPTVNRIQELLGREPTAVWPSIGLAKA